MFFGSNIKYSANVKLPRYTTAGFPIKATAVLSFLLLPPEYSSTFLSMCLVKFKSFASRFIKAGISFGRIPRNSANNSNVSAPVKSSSSASNCGQYLKVEWIDKMWWYRDHFSLSWKFHACTNPIILWTSGISVFRLMPRTYASPLEIFVSPVNILNVDVFPAPLTPRSPKHSALWKHEKQICIELISFDSHIFNRLTC